MILRSVGVLSCGKVLGRTYALLGLLVGLFFGLFSMAGVAINGQQGGNAMMPFMAVGVGAVIIFPIIYGVIGFIGGMIAAAVYYLVAAMVGGIELQFERPAATFTAP